MTTYQTAGASLVLLACACLVPTAVQRIRHRRARRAAAVERHDRAELVRMTGQRDRYYVLYHEAVKRNAVLLGLAESPVAVVDTALFDRACLAWLDKSTEWDAS